MKSSIYPVLKSACLPALLSLNLVSCGPSAWSESQKNSLSTVSLGTPSIAADGYKSADPVSLATQKRAGATAAGFGALGGILGAGLGAAVAGGMTGVEGSNFKSNHAQLLGTLDQQMKLPISSDVNAAYAGVLKKDSFFSSRLNPSSSNRFEVEVLGYGFGRVKGEEEDLFTPYLTTAVTLKTADGKQLLKRLPIHGSAFLGGGVGHPLHRFAHDKKLLRTEWDRAVRANAANFDKVLKHRLGE